MYVNDMLYTYVYIYTCNFNILLLNILVVNILIVYIYIYIQYSVYIKIILNMLLYWIYYTPSHHRLIISGVPLPANGMNGTSDSPNISPGRRGGGENLSPRQPWLARKWVKFGGFIGDEINQQKWRFKGPCGGRSQNGV